MIRLMTTFLILGVSIATATTGIAAVGLTRIEADTVSSWDCNCRKSRLEHFAGEQKLEFQLVTKLIDPTIVEAANIDGQKMMTSKAFGVAYFKDGRVAAKDFIVSSELRNGSGPGRGYSTYTFFDDGSSITASFVAEYKDGRAHGTYTILSGTGIYENATGTGTFDNIPSGFKGANLYNGTFDVKTPDKSN